MSSEENNVPTHRLQALSGPLQGAMFVVTSHLTIGRSCESDIQILQGGVSRKHAQVVTMPDGRHRVVDLSSANGTFVDDRRISECVLEPGMVLRIARSRFVYEPIPFELQCGAAAEGLTLRRVGGEGLRALQTAEHEGAANEGVEPVREEATVDLLAPAPARNEAEAMQRGAQGTESRGRDRMARLPGGSRYVGDLLEDVVAYRSLRTRKLRDDELELPDVERFLALDGRLRPPPDGSGARRYHRFDCHIPAFLRLLTGRTLPVVVENLGVDGARISVPWHRLATNTIAWLAIDVVHGRESSIVVLSGRVVWWEREHLGMSFSGSPGWARRGGRESRVPTHLDSERGVVSRMPPSAEATQWLEPEELAK